MQSSYYRVTTDTSPGQLATETQSELFAGYERIHFANECIFLNANPKSVDTEYTIVLVVVVAVVVHYLSNLCHTFCEVQIFEARTDFQRI